MTWQGFVIWCVLGGAVVARNWPNLISFSFETKSNYIVLTDLELAM